MTFGGLLKSRPARSRALEILLLAPQNLASKREATKRSDLPALTGLRFVAAFSVVMAHAVVFVRFSPEPHQLTSTAAALLSIGMSLFFVLSGFVIHYNYSELLRTPSVRNVAKFYTARLARLYPLYLFFLIVLIGFEWTTRDIVAISFYLGFAQTWTYLFIDGKGLLSQLSYANITWSISTEWFFYCLYPVIAWLMFRWTDTRIGASLLIVASGLYMALISTAYANQQAIIHFAEAHWGTSAAQPGMDSFFSWLVWFSPGRLHEFLGGVISAHLFMTLQHLPVGRREAWFGNALLAAGLVALASLQIGLQIGPWTTFAPASAFIVPIATGTILFCCARYKSLFSRAMSARPMIVCGDASYAIYLFHLKMLYEGFSAGVSLPLTGYSITYAAVRFALTVTVLLVLAIGIYRVIEFPARRWIRRSLGERIERDLTASYAIVGACVGIPALLAIVGWIITFGWQ